MVVSVYALAAFRPSAPDSKKGETHRKNLGVASPKKQMPVSPIHSWSKCPPPGWILTLEALFPPGVIAPGKQSNKYTPLPPRVSL